MAQSKAESRKPKGGQSQLQVNRFSFFRLCGKTQMLFLQELKTPTGLNIEIKKG